MDRRVIIIICDYCDDWYIDEKPIKNKWSIWFKIKADIRKMLKGGK